MAGDPVRLGRVGDWRCGKGKAGCSGMTLLELLVALAIFAVLAAMAYGGLDAVLKADGAVRQQARDLAALQRTLAMISRDLAQIAPRTVRGAYGDEQPVLDATREGYLEWTRAGWANPAGQLRSDLQRVAYGLEGEALVRLYWSVLDRAQDSRPRRAILLEGVSGFRVRVLDASRQWREVWPRDRSAQAASSLPLAVEVRLHTERWGDVRRLIPLPGAA